MRILIVEDNPVDELAVRATLGEVFDDATTEIRACATVGQAVDVVDEGDIR